MLLRAAMVRVSILAVAVVVAACSGGAPRQSSSPPTRPTPTPSSSVTASASLTTARAVHPDPDTLYTVPAALLRPLHPHSVASACRTEVNHFLAPAFGPGLGHGPIYPAGTKDGVVRVEFPPPASSGFAHSAYSGQKILWVGAPRYRGPVLIRGYAIDGSQHRVRFGAAIHPYAAMQLPPGRGGSTTTTQGGWRNWPSFTRVSAPGCYAWQIDGRNFSYTINLRVVRQRTQ